MWASRTGLGGLSLVLGFAACTSNPAPKGWLAPAPEAVSDPFGAWVRIELAPAGNQTPLGGELIAVAVDSVFVLTPDARFHAIAQADVTWARVAHYDSQFGQLGTWTMLGSVTTLSHGWFLSLSLPVWTIWGSLTTGAQSRAPLEDVREGKNSWEAVGKYARFPQGLPPDVDRGRLQPKPRE